MTSKSEVLEGMQRSKALPSWSSSRLLLPAFLSWFKQVTMKVSLFFILGVLQLGIQHTIPHSCRLRESHSQKQRSVHPGHFTSLLWLQTCTAHSRASSVLAGCFCQVVWEKEGSALEQLLALFRVWKVGRDTARKSNRPIAVFFLSSFF